MNASRIQQKTERGEPAFGICLMWPTPGVIEAIGGAWDFVWIDAQHGILDYRAVVECVAACDRAGTSALVRVPGHATEWIGPVLDLAPAGIIVPMVNTPQEAEAVVERARFAPMGGRSYGGRRIIDLHGRDYVKDANRRQLVLAQIETPQAVENARAIAQIDGIDWLFYGPDDTRLALGLPMDTPLTADPIAAMGKQVVEAAAAAGKPVMVPTGPRAEPLRWALKTGFRGIVVGADVSFVKEGSAAAAKVVAER